MIHKKILTIAVFFSSILNAVSTEEMVGEMLLVHFHGAEANHESAELLREAHVGGFIFYNWANELSSPSQVTKLTGSLNLQSEKPLFFAVDQEGGRVLRLTQGFSTPPYNAEITSSENAYAWAKKVGEELKAVGINMNLAPVVDVNSNPGNPVIGLRSYSSDPSVVVARATAALNGYRDAGITAVIKHFPGHGDTRVDSHFYLPVINKTLEELEKVELYPFRHLADNTPAIMTAHLLIPALDKERCVTLSRTIIPNILIKDMHFKGLIMTDSLAMQAVLNQNDSIEEVAIQAIEAGHDLLVLGGKQLLKADRGFEFCTQDIISIHRAICEAVKNKRIPLERIQNSYDKIVGIKRTKI